MKQLEHVVSNLDTQSAEDEAADILGALDLGMIFGGRL